MPKLRFDPVTYQFYYRCGPQDGATAKAAGFGWDPVRRRYFTEDPNVAESLESHGDFYARLLLADVLGAVTSPQHLQRGSWIVGAGAPDKRDGDLVKHGPLTACV